MVYSVIQLDHDGKFVRQFRLEAEVGGVLVDGDSLYAWCHSKNSYDEWKGALYGKMQLHLNSEISHRIKQGVDASLIK